MIPFLSRLTKGKTPAKAAKSKPTPKPIEKPSGERMRKTVMPSATRTVTPQDPFALASQSAANGGTKTGAPPRTVAFSQPQRELPPAVALALEPRVERAISIELADVFNELPVEFLKPRETIDTTRRILLKAAEVEKGMANGNPTVSLASVYQQIPEIFAREIPASDMTQVQLPFAKVLEQFASLQVRSDQQRAQAVPQLETPFLQVTREDNSRLGIAETEQVEGGDLSPIRMEAPTAQAFAAAEPEALASEIYRAPAPAMPESTAHPQDEFSDGAQTTPAPTRIPFKLSPQGADASADPGVPAAAGGASVLSGLAKPTRIPFKMSPPADELRGTSSAHHLTAPGDPAKENTGSKISLALKPILQSLPAFQLSGDPNSVPNDLYIELPFSKIEPQLAKGRIAIEPQVFETALPVNFRGVFNGSEKNTDVILPLQEVLKNLPSHALHIRDDQEEQAARANYATSFSATAAEDAQRLKVSGEPIAKQIAPPNPPRNKNGSFVPERTEELPPAEVLGAASPSRNPLQAVLGTDEILDAKGVLMHINRLPGIEGSAIQFGDGLSLAGKLPEELKTDALMAMAPSMLQRIEQHMAETNLGGLRSVTLSCATTFLTIFLHDNLYLAAIHASELETEIREKLARIVHELSRKYSQQPV